MVFKLGAVFISSYRELALVRSGMVRHTIYVYMPI